jgi:hypothetical protein
MVNQYHYRIPKHAIEVFLRKQHNTCKQLGKIICRQGYLYRHGGIKEIPGLSMKQDSQKMQFKSHKLQA